MGVIVIEIYPYTNSPNLSTYYRREREEVWIKELGTTSPYGCNDNVSSVGNLSSPSCSNINVMNYFRNSKEDDVVMVIDPIHPLK